MTIILMHPEVLWQFKKDEIDNNVDVSVGNSSLFEYKSDLIANVAANGTGKNMKIAVSLKHLSNFWISLEMPLINSKAELPLTWVKKCILSSATGAAVTAGTAAAFEMRDAKLYVPVVTLLTEDNVKLTKQLNDGFKRSIYGNKYKIIFNKDRVNPPYKGT